MGEVIEFLIPLGKLFEIAEQEAGVDNQHAIYTVAKLYLDEKNVTIEDVEEAVADEDYREKYKDIDDVMSLVYYIKWKNTFI